MRKSILYLVFAVILCTAPHLLWAETTDTISFPNKNEPRVLMVSGSGDVVITGYNGDDVRVVSENGVTTSEADTNDEKARGLTKLTAHGFSINTIEEKNAIVINRPVDDESDVTIEVPKQVKLIIGNTSGFENLFSKTKEKVKVKEKSTGSSPNPIVTPDVDVYINGNNIADMILNTVLPNLNGILEGDITVSNIEGDVEVSTVDGDISLTNISGTISVSSVEGDIDVVIDKITKEQSMYFSSVEGDIDVTLSPKYAADIMMNTVEGDIYTGFTISNVNSTVSNQSSDSFWGGSMVGSRISGTINGGGPEITLKSVEGTIYLRNEPYDGK